MHCVYLLKENEKIIYVGYTNNIKNRLYLHNYHLQKGTKKILYDYLRQQDISKIDKLEIIFCGSKVECKRYEAMLILQDHFSPNPQLKQQIPKISDRGF